MSPNKPAEKEAWVRSALARYQGALIRYAAGITGDQEAAYDAVQETFLRLLTADRARVEARLAEWLFTVCRSRAIDGLRRSKRMEPLSEANARPSAEAPPHEAAERRETSGRVRRAIENLSASQQEIIRLRYQEGLTSRQIGRMRGLPAGQVRYLLHVAIRSIRCELAQPSGCAAE